MAATDADCRKIARSAVSSMQIAMWSIALRYLSDAELRQTIQAATNKSEAFSRFVQWLFFGGEGIIASNDRAKQRKRIKYNHLIANCVIFHNVHAQTRILYQLAQEGQTFNQEVLAHLSSYLTAYVNRFGSYTWNFDRQVPSPDDSMDLGVNAA
jgi:TnpA family transposase